MEERKLNFNAPLMSVRRYSMASGSSDGINEKKLENFKFSRRNTLPVTRPHFNLDQVTEPVAVPFNWEQIPGRAKNDSGSASPECQLPWPPERTSSTPRLSFGRALEVKKQILEREAWNQNECEEKPLNASVIRLESTKTIMKYTRSLTSEKDDDDDYDDDGDDYFSDARDSLSPTDSYSVNNCTVSGISGHNGPDVKPSGTFRMDPQTRDFMMNRFLPAAKAMVLEPAKYALKKQLVAVEQPKQAKKITPENRTAPLKKLESTMFLQYGKEEVDEDSDVGDDEYDNSVDISARGCGLIPNLCFKNTLSLLNPVPGMKIRTPSPMAFAHKVGGSGRTTYVQSHSQQIKKHTLDNAYKQKLEGAVQSPRVQEVKDKWIGESKQFHSAGDLQMNGRSLSSPFRRSRAPSPFRDEASSQTPIGKQLVIVPKKIEIVTKPDTPSNRATKQELDPANSMVEKTLFVDTASVARISSLNFSPLEDKDNVGRVGKENENEIANGEKVIEGTTNSELSFQEVKCLTWYEEGTAGQEVPESKSRDNDEVSATDESESCYANYQIVKVEDPSSDKVSSVISSQPPPLPKSPSESWLWRTLPSVSSKKPAVGNRLYHRRLSPNTSSSNTKWETIVKTSNLRHDHVRYSEELVSRAPQHSKTENFK